MSFLNLLRSKISPQNSFLLAYHKLVAILAALWYRFPANHLRVIAVTGTKGKSTTVHFLAGILKAAGYRVGVSSSIHFQIGDDIWPNTTKQTTLGRFTLQGLLRRMVKARCDFAVIEVTSHALMQSRIWGINIDTAILTNIQRDHLEYHGSFENYLHAKGLLFSILGNTERKEGIQKTAVLPAEEPQLKYFESFPADRQIHYGFSKGEIHAGGIELSSAGSRFTLKVPNEQIKIHLKIPGDFNVRNALGAAGAALSFGIKLSDIKKGLEAEANIPGRLEPIHAGQPFTVIVDYAHTVESLESLLSLFKPLTKGRLWLVFGATGGGRDKSKRAKMGTVAAQYADIIIVTDDDPYTENRMQIIEQVAAGTGRREGRGLWKIRDRFSAISLALLRAKEEDTVLIAGKGCEPIQIIGEKHIPWDDRKVAGEILKKRLVVEIR